MRRARIFVILIAIVSVILLILDLPFAYTLQVKVPKIPFISNSDTPQQEISIPLIKEYTLGLDLQGGVRLTYDLDTSEIGILDRQAALESTRSVIERRINTFGVTEPVIQTVRTGTGDRVVVELPGVTDVAQAVDLIGKTAQLEFWEVSEESISAEEATSSAYPLGSVFVAGDRKPVKTSLTGKDLESSNVGFNGQQGETEVVLRFTQSGAKQFGEITKRNLGKPVMIVLDNIVLQAPIVQTQILDGNASITGGFNTETAKNVSIALNAGALPVPLELVAQTNIGPSLGLVSLKQSIVGGILGFISILIFMIYMYRREGFLASIALIIYTILVLFVFKIIPVTLTLAGIAGFILSIGMAVDANILIFERINEERRAGRSRAISVQQGFKRAWSSIRDSNIASIITSVLLFYLGTGIVRGFALTLLIGILVSMFSAIVVTRNLLKVFDTKEKVGKSV